MRSVSNAIRLALVAGDQEFPDPIASVLRDPLLDQLVVALCRASAAFLETESGVFAVAATIKESGEIEPFHVSLMDGVGWFRTQIAISDALTIGLDDDLFAAAGHCMNIASAGVERSDRAPVLAVRIDRKGEPAIHVVVPYELLGDDGEVRFGKPRVSPATAGRDDTRL
jgi:hypothetical protein